MIKIEEKKVTFLISSSPFQTLNNYEALRTSIGLFYHKTSIIWIDDGVFFASKSTKDNRTAPFLRLVKDMEIELYVNLDDFKNRNYDQTQIIDTIKPIDEDSFNDLIINSDVVMTF